MAMPHCKADANVLDECMHSNHQPTFHAVERSATGVTGEGSSKCRDMGYPLRCDKCDGSDMSLFLACRRTSKTTREIATVHVPCAITVSSVPRFYYYYFQDNHVSLGGTPAVATGSAEETLYALQAQESHPSANDSGTVATTCFWTRVRFRFCFVAGSSIPDLVLLGFQWGSLIWQLLPEATAFVHRRTSVCQWR